MQTSVADRDSTITYSRGTAGAPQRQDLCFFMSSSAPNQHPQIKCIASISCSGDTHTQTLTHTSKHTYTHLLLLRLQLKRK